MTHKFIARKIKEEELSVKYEFVLESGEPNEGLLRTVFGEYIEEPMLKRGELGQSFVMIGQCPLLSGMMHFSTEEDIANNRIYFSVASQQLKNKVVSVVEEEEDVMHLKMSDGVIVRLKNATDRAIPQIFFLLMLVDILDGMVIEVDIADYYPNCSNCCMNVSNLKKYIKLANEKIIKVVEGKQGCFFDYSQFDVGKKKVECGNFIRSKNPDIRELLETLSVFSEIENF